MTKQSHYNVGIYVRLSQEDERAGESISIENQKKNADGVRQQANRLEFGGDIRGRRLFGY